MAQRNPIEHDTIATLEVARKELERLAAEQGLQPIVHLDSFRADFWPEEESVDDFVRTVRECRRNSEKEVKAETFIGSFPIALSDGVYGLLRIEYGG
jgi:hypothetical protein